MLGFQGSYNRVAAFARAWTARRQGAEQTAGLGTFAQLMFAAGEAFQFDWSEDWAVIGGETTKLQVAHFKLSHSRAFVLRAWGSMASGSQIGRPEPDIGAAEQQGNSQVDVR